MGSILPIKHSQVFSSGYAALEASLGDRWLENGKEYVLCQVGTAAIAAGASQVVVQSYVGGTPSFKVKTTVSARDDDVLGVIPDDIVVASTVAGRLDAGDFVAVQVKGAALAKANSTAVNGDLLFTSTVAGRAREYTAAATSAAGLLAGFAIARNTTALGTAAGGTIKVELLGLR